MPDWPTIPDFTKEDIETPVRALKNLVEMITRQRAAPAGYMARVFIQTLDPSKDPKVTSLRGTTLKNGDLWIDQANNSKLRYWDEAARGWAPTT